MGHLRKSEKIGTKSNGLSSLMKTIQTVRLKLKRLRGAQKLPVIPNAHPKTVFEAMPPSQAVNPKEQGDPPRLPEE